MVRHEHRTPRFSDPPRGARHDPTHVGGFLQPAGGRQSGDRSTNRWWIGETANHGAVFAVRAKNRPKLERLCRNLLGPPVSEDRLSLAPDGSVLVRLKTPWRDGTSHIVLQPLELLEKLAALIPRPYVNLIVYHRVLAPNARWRGEVVDFGRPQVDHASPATTPKKVAASYNRTWAELMRRGLDIDVLECPACGGRLRFVADLRSPRRSHGV